MTENLSRDKKTVSPDSGSRDELVLGLYDRLLEIEQRLIPTSLHILGQPTTEHDQSDMLMMLASFDRPEQGIKALPDLVADALGLESYNSLLKRPRYDDSRVAVDDISRAAVQELIGSGAEQAAIGLNKRAGVNSAASLPLLSLLQKVADALTSNNEIEAVTKALRGEYIEPGPGADLVQNPEILPTGRNTHAINPYGVPSVSAFIRSEVVVSRLLERHLRENGSYPRSIALVLWGLDNIKTQGEGVAQALWLLGVKPLRDRLNRVTDVEVISLEKLGRPRIDVVMTVSGIFRDLFGCTLNLLDLAVRKVADLDESPEHNFVRRNISEQCVEHGCTFDDAILRVFSNAPGNYGTNVNFMVQNSQWEHGSALGDLFVRRKSFAYGRDRTGRNVEGREDSDALDRALANVEATFQNIDTYEVGITDVDHYFEYLGAVSKAVEDRSGQRPSIYLSDSLSRNTTIRSLSETVELETRTKTLNPKWYEGMLKHGFRGVAEIEGHVTNTFGWSATTDAVDDWVYTEVANTFVLDEAMLERLANLNVNSARSLAARLMEAHSRGFWDAEQEVLDRLRTIFSELEDRIEGVA
jgi:magnesium chelatase subunit H